MDGISFCFVVFSQDEEGSLEPDDEWISEDDWKDLVLSVSEDELEQVGYFHFKKKKGIIQFILYLFIYLFIPFQGFYRFASELLQ